MNAQDIDLNQTLLSAYKTLSEISAKGYPSEDFRMRLAMLEIAVNDPRIPAEKRKLLFQAAKYEPEGSPRVREHFKGLDLEYASVVKDRSLSHLGADFYSKTPAIEATPRNAVQKPITPKM